MRDAARKHRVPVDGLPALLAETQAQLAAHRRRCRRCWKRPSARGGAAPPCLSGGCGRAVARAGHRGADGWPRRWRRSCRRCGSSAPASGSGSEPLGERGGCRWGGAGGVRGQHQPRPALRSDRQDRLGRRAVPLHAGAEGGAGAAGLGRDADLRRGRRRPRRCHRRRGRRAAGPAGCGASGAGRHPCAAGRRPRRPPLHA